MAEDLPQPAVGWRNRMSAWVSHSVFIVATWIAAICGGVGIGAAFISAIVGYQLTEGSLAEANKRIAESEAEAAKANEAAGKAHERAAALERDAEASRAAIAEANARAAEAGQKAEEEKLARVKLEHALQPRHLTKAQAKAIGEHVRDHLPPNLMLAYVGSDRESSEFAMEIDWAIQDARPDKGGLPHIVLDQPRGYPSRLVAPGIMEKDFPGASGISHANWRERSRRALEILGPFSELGFSLTLMPPFPEYPDTPVLYVAPKGPPQIGDAKPWWQPQ